MSVPIAALSSALFQPSAPKPDCHGQRVLAARVERGVVELGQQVGPVGDQVLVELLDVAVLDPQRGHPVRQHDDVAADVLPLLELGAHLRVELAVVVHVLGVDDLEAGQLLERLEARTRPGLVVDVDVERPVRPVDELVDRGHVLGRSHLLLDEPAAGPAAPEGLVRRPARCGDHGGSAEARCMQQPPPRDRGAHRSGDRGDDFRALRGHVCSLRRVGAGVQRTVKIVRCHGFRASPVMSIETCLMFVYSSNE